jgi:hypothetical protein
VMLKWGGGKEGRMLKFVGDEVWSLVSGGVRGMRLL